MSKNNNNISIEDTTHATKSSETIRAIVTFYNPVDFHKVEEYTKQEPTLHGKKISIKKVPKCKSILVKNLPNSSTLDSVTRLFKNEIVGGGGIEQVTLDLEKRTAVVPFKDPNVVDKILSLRHTLDNVTLSVERYYPILANLVDLPPPGLKTSKPTPKPRKRKSSTTNSDVPALKTTLQKSFTTESAVPITKTTIAKETILTADTEVKTLQIRPPKRTTCTPKREAPEPKPRTPKRTTFTTESKVPTPKPRTPEKTTHTANSEAPIPKPRTPKGTRFTTDSEAPIPKLRTSEQTDHTANSEAPIPKPRTPKETTSTAEREVPTSQPSQPKLNVYTVKIDRDLYDYIKEHHLVEPYLALKDPSPKIEQNGESVNFTFSSQDAKEHFLTFEKDYKYEIVPINPVLVDCELREEIKNVKTAIREEPVSFKESYNEGFIKFFGRAGSILDLAIEEVKKCINKAEEKNHRREDIIELLPVYLKFLRRSTSFQRLENSWKTDGCEIQMDDTTGKITVTGSQAQIKNFKIKTQDIVCHFNEQPLKHRKFSLLKTLTGLSQAKTMLLTENLSVEILVNDQDSMMLYGMNETQVQQASKSLENAIAELELPPSLKTKSSQDAFLKELGTSTPLTMQTDEGQPRIICFKNQIGILRDKLDDFLERRKTVEVKIPLDKVVVRYLTLYEEALLENLRRSSSGLNIVKGSDALIVSGENLLVENCRARIHNFAVTGLNVERVQVDTCAVDTLERIALVKENVERKHRCAVVMTLEEKPDERSLFRAPLNKTVNRKNNNQSRTMQCRYTFPEDKVIEIHQGDILNHPVDYLVNSANDELKHSRGLAKAIVEKGGREIQDECSRVLENQCRDTLPAGEVVTTGSGSLICKTILHVVVTGHRPVGGNELEAKGVHLRHCCTNVFKKATDGQTVAIPALATGVYAVPHDISAKSLIEAATEFLLENPNHALKEVHFVDNDPAAIEAFMKEMIRSFQRDPNFEINDLAYDRWRLYLGATSLTSSPTSVPRSRDVAFKTDEAQKVTAVEIVQGDIVQQATDAIGFLVEEDIRQGGQIGKALHNAAGEDLEKEYSTFGRLETGTVVMTTAGKLHAKKLLHMVTKTTAVTSDNSMIHDAVRQCLNEADDWGFTSLSLPAVGTGHLQKDAKESADILYSCIEEYQKRKEKKLKLIKIVILEENIFADFKKAFEEKDPTMSTEPEVIPRMTRQQITLEIAADRTSDMARITEELKKMET